MPLQEEQTLLELPEPEITNTHKNPDEFWHGKDKGIQLGIGPTCPISFCASCSDCIYRHQCTKSEYKYKNPELTWSLKEEDGVLRWREVPIDET